MWRYHFISNSYGYPTIHFCTYYQNGFVLGLFSIYIGHWQFGTLSEILYLYLTTNLTFFIRDLDICTADEGKSIPTYISNYAYPHAKSYVDRLTPECWECKYTYLPNNEKMSCRIKNRARKRCFDFESSAFCLIAK